MRALVLMATVWCGAVAALMAGDVTVPPRLSETGLYEAGRLGVVAAANRPFSPQYPLWTDGAVKRRWVYLPPGATIDATDRTEWDLPVGTKLWKEFSFDGRPVETRMIWRASATRWIFAAYVWSQDGSDAHLSPETGVRGAAPLPGGKRHDVPSVSDCTACHGSTRPGVLGFNALQLSPDRDPNAIHREPLQADMLTLDVLRREGRLAGLDAAAYATAPRIETSDPQTRAALGYLLANCGHCHNGRGEIAALGPTLRYDELLTDGDAVARTLDHQPTRWQVPGIGDGASVLVAPEAPDRSALLVRMRSRSPSSQMPPLGTVLRDTAAVEQLTAWVTRHRGPRSRR